METEFFQKAKDNYTVAQLCFDNGFYDACANRAYYAAFQAAVAALANKGIRREKFGHDWVQSEFNGKLIARRKVYPGKMKSYLMKMQIVRNRADYGHKQVSKTECSKQLKKAKELIEIIGRELNHD